MPPPTDIAYCQFAANAPRACGGVAVQAVYDGSGQPAGRWVCTLCADEAQKQEMAQMPDAYPPEFLALLAPGVALRLDYGPDNVNNKIRHIRAIVDDDEVVYRVWSYRRQRWAYQVEDRCGLWYEWQHGYLRKA
jgi:hypothetical protein